MIPNAWTRETEASDGDRKRTAGRVRVSVSGWQRIGRQGAAAGRQQHGETDGDGEPHVGELTDRPVICPGEHRADDGSLCVLMHVRHSAARYGGSRWVCPTMHPSLELQSSDTVSAPLRCASLMPCWLSLLDCRRSRAQVIAGSRRRGLRRQKYARVEKCYARTMLIQQCCRLPIIASWKLQLGPDLHGGHAVAAAARHGVQTPASDNVWSPTACAASAMQRGTQMLIICRSLSVAWGGSRLAASMHVRVR